MTNRMRDLVILTLGMVWLACTDANAQAHGPPATEFLDEAQTNDPAKRLVRLAEMDDFLRRLVGRFRDTRGVSNYSERMVDCTGVGAGPGVQCVFGLGSNSDTGGGLSVLLFGLDPVAQRVNFLRVNPKGIAEGGLGTLSGNTLRLKFPCFISDDASMGMISCEDRVQFYTLAGSKEVAMTSERILMLVGGREQRSIAYNWLTRIPRVSGGTHAGGD